MPGKSIIGVYSVGGDSGTIAFTLDPVSQRGADFSKLVGNYNSVAGVFSIDSNGTLIGSDTAGVFTGTVTIPDASINVYRVAYDYTQTNGVVTHYTGLGVLGDGATQNNTIYAQFQSVTGVTTTTFVRF